MKIRVNTIDYRGSIVDGPGIRTVLFLQGCTRQCESCHNPSTWNLNGGKLIEIDALVEDLKQNCINRKLTISGGEPLLQEKQVLDLIKKLPDFDLALYTGYELNDVSKEILKQLNYIKVGPYKDTMRTTTTPYIGSTNQKFINLQVNNITKKKKTKREKNHEIHKL